MRWICTLFLFFCFVFSSNVYAESATSVVEARIVQVLNGHAFELQILKVRNGRGVAHSIIAEVPPNQKELLKALVQFRTRKWMVTLQHTKGLPLIRAAFGLQDDQESQRDLLPDPQLIPKVLIQKNPEPGQSGRTLDIGTKEQEMVELTNQARWDNGRLPPLKQNNLLHKSADCHSDRMAQVDFFAHCDLYTNKSPFTRMNDAQYYYNSAGENIAAGLADAYATIFHNAYGWMNSSGHRANILSTSYREIGVGYDYSNDGQSDRFDNGSCDPGASGGPYYHYWTQNFGRRSNVYPVVIERELASTANQTVDLFVYGPVNATSMRFRNEGGTWSSWISYTPDHTWTLSAGNGTKTIHSEVSTGANGTGTIYAASDQITLSGHCSTMTISNQTLSGSRTYSDCEIVADPNVMISGQITLQATTVTLGSSVTVPIGATLNISIQ